MLCTGEVVAYRWSNQDFSPLSILISTPFLSHLFCLTVYTEERKLPKLTHRFLLTQSKPYALVIDYQSLWCHHSSLCVPIRNVLLPDVSVAAESGMQCQFSCPPKSSKGGNQRNITKIRWAFSMEILISLTLLASLPPRCLEEQLNSTNNKMKDVETMMRFWCLWKSFRTSPSPKET